MTQSGVGGMMQASERGGEVKEEGARCGGGCRERGRKERGNGHDDKRLKMDLGADGLLR